MSKRGESATVKLAVVVVAAGVVFGLVVAGRRLGGAAPPAPAPAPGASGASSPVPPGPATDAAGGGAGGAMATSGDGAADASVTAADLTAMREALLAGELGKVQDLFAKGVPLTDTLERAASSGNVALVTWLLEHGVDPHEDEGAAISPLAAADAYPDVTKVLLARGTKEPTIVHAVQAAAPNAVTRILAKDKAAASSRNEEGLPLLTMAVRDSAGAKRIALVQALLDAGAKPDATSEHGTALAAAVSGVNTKSEGAMEVVKALLARGATVDLDTLFMGGPSDKADAAALQEAFLGGKIAPDAAYLMILGERDPKTIARIGAKGVKWTADHPMLPPTPPLVTAARELDVERVNALLAAGAPVDRAGEGDETPLFSAIDAAGPDSTEAAAIAAALLAKGANPNKRTAGGLRPLHLAAEKGEEAIVKALLAKGAHVDDEVSGTTALEAAETNGHQGVAKLLLARGAKKRSASH